MNKYHNRKVKIGNDVFDSEREYTRWCELKLMERAGLITDLQRQVPFELVPAQREPPSRGPRGAERQGKLLERPVTYVADFVYSEGSERVVEDCKGMRTDEYIIKRKLMLYILHIKIKET